jgi:excisionase family DNA binding protein
MSKLEAETGIEKLVVSEREAAKMLSLSTRTMFEMRRRGGLPFIRLGSKIGYRVESLRKWLENNEEVEKTPEKVVTGTAGESQPVDARCSRSSQRASGRRRS